MPNQKVVVKYQTRKHYCSCCDQKLPTPKTSKVKNFVISKDNTLSWASWDEAAEYPEDIERMVPEFVYETIRFWAVDSDVKVIIEDSEIERVKSWILAEVVS